MFPKLTRRTVGLLLLLCGIVLLFFGLQLKTYRFSSAPQLQPDLGISFADHSLAYTRLAVDNLKLTDSYYIQVKLSGLRDHTNYLFETIASLELENNEVFLIVGQWNNYIIFRQDNNFAQSDTATVFNISEFAGNDNIIIDAVINSEEIVLKVNDIIVPNRRNTLFNAPDTDLNLFVGGLSDKTSTWKGAVAEINLGTCLEPVANESKNTEDCSKRESWVRYDFKSDGEKGLQDLSNNGFDLAKSSPLLIHKWKWLITSVNGGALSPNHLKDVLINIVGFMPLGFLLAAFRYVSNPQIDFRKAVSTRSDFNELWLTIGTAMCVGFMFSLFIESAQVLLPSRVSSLFDLVANTAGTVCGAAIFVALKRYVFSRFCSKEAA